MEGKVVLVTGAAGFIGSHLCDILARENTNRLVLIDNLFLGKIENLNNSLRQKNVVFLEGDAGSESFMTKTIEKYKVQVIFNLAVIPLLTSLEVPRFSYEENVRIVVNLCELLRNRNYETLIHCSSSEAYGTAKYIPMDEDHPLDPHTPYAASKAASDLFILSYCKTFGIDARIIRPFNNYGPRQNDGSYAGVIPVTIKRILSGQKPIIYGDGNQMRDYSYVMDTVKAFIAAYEHDQAISTVINIASGAEIRIGHLIGKISNLLGYAGEFEFGPPRAGDVQRHLGSVDRAKRILNYKPSTSFDLGLKETVEWYRNKLEYAKGVASAR